jgi:hypothetical protein
MKTLHVKNARSNYGTDGIAKAKALDDLNEIDATPDSVLTLKEKLTYKIEMHKIMIGHSKNMISAKLAAIHARNLDQVDKIEKIETRYRNPEVSEFPYDPIEQVPVQKSIEQTNSDNGESL